MDLQLVLTPLFSVIIYLIPLILFLAILNSSWFKGKLGELIVNYALKKAFQNKHYHLITDVTLPTENGTTQVDHILLSCYGIFVLETKNYKGWIFGHEHQKQWTQKIYKKNYKFQNPLHQNYKHIKTLEMALKLSSDHFYSIIIFSKEATFKTRMPNNVTYTKQAIELIKSYKEVIFTLEEFELIKDNIEDVRLRKGISTDLQHIKHLKENKKKENSKLTCPRCDSLLTQREVKRGTNIGQQFWGCSNFPKCRYTKK